VKETLVNLGPFANGTDNTGELRFSSSNVAAAAVLPLSWRGRFVEVTNESATAAEIIAFLFTYSAVTITLGAAAADGGGAAGRGRVLLAGQKTRVFVPSARQQGEAVTFNRIAASGTPVISVALVS